MRDLYIRRFSPKRIWKIIGVLTVIISLVSVFQINGIILTYKTALLILLLFLIIYWITQEVNLYYIFKEFLNQKVLKEIVVDNTSTKQESRSQLLLDDISTYLNAKENKQLYHQWHLLSSQNKLHQEKCEYIESIFKTFCNDREMSIIQKRFFEERKERNASN